MFRRAITSTLALLLLIVSLVSAPVSGASVTGGNGIKLSPIKYNLSINPGSIKTIVFDVENVTKTTATYKAVVSDFTADNVNGTPQLIVNSNKYDPYSIKKFISPIPEFSVKGGQTAQIKVIITIPASTAGGGYFGAIRFLVVNPNTGQTVNISASVAGLILLTVPGPALNENMTLVSFSTNQNGSNGGLFYSNKGIVAVAKFSNNGNVQLAPFGKITVKNMNGDTIETKTINNSNPPGNVLPGSEREFSVPLSNLGTFGKYTVSGYFGYGNKGQLLSASTSFYVVAPWIIILAVVIVLIILITVFFTPKIFRAWYKRSIRKAKKA